jgi:hypothetical protein
MDQLRKAVAWLKQYHFWVLCALVALISVGCWWKASAKMVETYKKGESTIKAGFDSVSKVKSEPFHANTDVNEKQAAETKKQSEAVAKLWKDLYERQSKEVLKWPDTLSAEFRAAIEKLSFGADIPATLRRNYQNYAQGHFKELPKLIGARPFEPSSAGAGGRGPEGIGPLMGNQQVQDDGDFICQWLDTDQEFIHKELYFPTQPSSLAIWVTQEDLWVYETLLHVIQKTNKAAGATRMSNAAVKVVAELALGQRAAKFSRTGNRLWVRPPVATAAVPGVGGEAPPGQGAGPEGGGAPRMEFSFDRMSASGPMSEEQERAYLLYGRYLDAQGKPIPFGNPGGGAAAGPEGGGAPDAAPAAPAGPLDVSVFGQEYKRVPVRMVLQMDQRWIPRLIAQCASEPLQVEVQEVRVNVPEAGMASSGPMAGMSRGPEGGGAGGGGSAASLFPEETQVLPFPSHPEIVNVIIQGTIYIFNKPNPAILQGDQPAPTQSAATP